ncbi:DMT family transporter [Amycolatopsis solani]|uniref:DMT family transporter n=1 Tax=Amycolatopsis solani TaxID=3028615 RepID=UPI0025B14248|nr:SMR family transporter [Amycolatopsis sp. MEP2-6]
MSAARVRGWLCLAATVVLEVVATLTLKASHGFTVPLPSVVSVAAYCGTTVMLAFALKVVPVSVAYVVWTGAGTAAVALLAAVLFADRLSPAGWGGVALVVVGVMLINARRGSRAPEEHTQ